MDFILEIIEFLLQAVILLGVFLIAVAGLFAISQRRRDGGDDGAVEARLLNDRYEEQREPIRTVVETPSETKARLKEKKRDEKQKKKDAKIAAKADVHEEKQTIQPRIFVVDFDGDMQASQVEQLREEVSAILPLATSTDEIVVRVESGGGVVHGYGLAASQLLRVKEAGIRLTVSVDKVAASGGYMMACVADTIIAAPFAIVGSIGVVAQLPNFHRLLKKNDIDFELHTAGEYKRTLTVFGENTDKAREKFQADIDDVHDLFKQFVAENRNTVSIDEVSTGEYWFGQRALEKRLVDRLCTSDSYLMEKSCDHDIVEVRYRARRSWQEKLGLAAGHVVDRSIKRLMKSERDQRFL
jgi:serine protease SohB